MRVMRSRIAITLLIGLLLSVAAMWLCHEAAHAHASQTHHSGQNHCSVVDGAAALQHESSQPAVSLTSATAESKYSWRAVRTIAQNEVTRDSVPLITSHNKRYILKCVWLI